MLVDADLCCFFQLKLWYREKTLSLRHACMFNDDKRCIPSAHDVVHSFPPLMLMQCSQIRRTLSNPMH